MNSQREKINAKGEFVLKNWFERFLVYKNKSASINKNFTIKNSYTQHEFLTLNQTKSESKINIKIGLRMGVGFV